ncbi:MAG: ATP-binding cassette domain-containing protein, partial [Spirochaetaceae bacterium]|nr:ATP-binding cassette domain-containing protein [Spirochaetaceae bacterium]
MSDYAIEMIGITKSFPGVLANDDITLRVRDQEIHALLGENGAGKSTLMSILFGLYQADAGTIKVRGRPVQIR